MTRVGQERSVWVAFGVLLAGLVAGEVLGARAVDASKLWEPRTVSGSLFACSLGVPTAFLFSLVRAQLPFVVLGASFMGIAQWRMGEYVAGSQESTASLIYLAWLPIGLLVAGGVVVSVWHRRRSRADHALDAEAGD